MEITIFAKKRTTKEGKIFYTYLTRLNRKDGFEETSQVKFREPAVAPKPENCPCNIIATKNNMNMSKKILTDTETGEIIESRTLWISNYVAGSEYIDHSMDDYE